MGKINLLPKHLREKKGLDLPAISGIRVLIIAILIFCAGVTAFLFMAISSVGSNIEDLRQEEEQVLALKERLEEAEGKHETLSERYTLLEAIGEPVVWSEFLDSVHRCTPANVWIDEIEAEAGEGASIQGSALNYEAVNSFLGCLQRLPEVVVAELTDAEKVSRNGASVVEFEIMCLFEVRTENDEPESETENSG